MAILKAMESAFGGTGFGSFLGLKGHASGGYTGDGNKYDIGGYVHKGEFVFTKEATSRLGVANLYHLMNNTKKGYATGGYVGPAATPMYGMQPVAGGATVVLSGDININGGQQQQLPSTNSAAIKKELFQVVEEGVTRLLRNPASYLSREIKGK